jgi:hypothetical protein
MGAKMSRDAYEYLGHLEQERYRAIILHAEPDKGPAVTQFAKKICKQLGGTYLDLLDLFIQTKELSEHIDRFGPEEFRKLLIEQSKGQPLLVVDRADFLLDTWRRAERKNFLGLLDKNQWDGFKEEMKARLMICLQTSQELEALRVSDSHGQSRVMRLSDFNDIL